MKEKKELDKVIEKMADQIKSTGTAKTIKIPVKKVARRPR